MFRIRMTFLLVQGTTWLALPFQENVIVFGSSFPSPAALESPKINDFLASSPKKLFIDGSRNLPDVVPLGLKVRNFFLKQIYQGYIAYVVLQSAP